MDSKHIPFIANFLYKHIDRYVTVTTTLYYHSPILKHLKLLTRYSYCKYAI